MKRTLFNTMMGCFAALSLVGCGGSGSSSSGPSASSGPSESLFSEGFEVVAIDAGVATSGSEEIDAGVRTSGSEKYELVYSLALYSSGQRFKLLLPKEGGDSEDPYDHVATGTWSAKSLGNGEFELWLGDTSDKGCTINGGSVRLTIHGMETYRAGEGTTATLRGAPFTHIGAGTCGYSGEAALAEEAKIQQLRSLPL